MMIGLMLFFDCILVDGRSLFVGLVKTDLNWFNNSSAFPFDWRNNLFQPIKKSVRRPILTIGVSLERKIT
jgi:hypothetical protein